MYFEIIMYILCFAYMPLVLSCLLHSSFLKLSQNSTNNLRPSWARPFLSSAKTLSQSPHPLQACFVEVSTLTDFDWLLRSLGPNPAVQLDNYHYQPSKRHEYQEEDTLKYIFSLICQRKLRRFSIVRLLPKRKYLCYVIVMFLKLN